MKTTNRRSAGRARKVSTIPHRMTSERTHETVVVEEGSRDRVDVGVGVLGLSVLGEDSRSDLEELVNELEDGVGGDLGTSEGELLEGEEAGVLSPE